jgi:predicted DNA binding CopG/RHH family protein
LGSAQYRARRGAQSNTWRSGASSIEWPNVYRNTHWSQEWREADSWTGPYKKRLEAEAAFAKEVYKDRAKLNQKALAILAGSRPVTIRLNNSEIALAKQQAEAKGLKYQTYMKMLLHESLHAARAERRWLCPAQSLKNKGDEVERIAI